MLLIDQLTFNLSQNLIKKIASEKVIPVYYSQLTQHRRATIKKRKFSNDASDNIKNIIAQEIVADTLGNIKHVI